MLTAQDEELIRRAIRHAVLCTREQDTDPHHEYLIEYLFDLVPYLKDVAQAIARDEAARALSENIGAD
jgi:hypothetical protein